MPKEIYEIKSVEFYSIRKDANVTVKVGRIFTRSNVSKLFRVFSAEIGNASVRIKNGVAICQSIHCDLDFINQMTCDHTRAVRALINDTAISTAIAEAVTEDYAPQ